MGWSEAGALKPRQDEAPEPEACFTTAERPLT